VSLAYDGDPRASYLLLDDSSPTIRRVKYDVEKEAKALSSAVLPHADWIAKTLRAASPQMPYQFPRQIQPQSSPETKPARRASRALT
jgi:hypothetical protein